MRTSVPGVATGLAWTPVGGDILFIEATRTPGSGKLILTGQLGEVMRESAQAALSIVKNRAAALGIDPHVFEKTDIHVHVPAGAIPKDGPSAGVAMFMALASLLTEPHRAQRHGDDRRDQPARARAAGGRHQGEGGGGGARRHQARACCRPATARTSRTSPRRRARQLEFVWLEQVDDAVRAPRWSRAHLPPRRRRRPGWPSRARSPPCRGSWPSRPPSAGTSASREDLGASAEAAAASVDLFVRPRPP